jgi:hypothetical protein
MSPQSEEVAGLIDMVLDVIESHVMAHDEMPQIVWVSEELHRQIVLYLPAVISGVTVCRSHSLKGVVAVAVHRPIAPEEEGCPVHTGHRNVQSGGWSCDEGTASPPAGPGGR